MVGDPIINMKGSDEVPYRTGAFENLNVELRAEIRVSASLTHSKVTHRPVNLVCPFVGVRIGSCQLAERTS